MSTVATCTRTAIPRATLRSTRFRRFLSTDVIPAEPAAVRVVPILLEKNKPSKYSLSEEMHRSIYPNLYERIEPGKPHKKGYIPPKKTKNINEKWKSTMRETGASKSLSKTFGIPVFRPSTLNIKKTCPSPIRTINASQISLLDPTGARTRLFAKDNPECARVGDILLVRQRTGEPFAGVCINIRRRGVDTAILLRGQLTRVGVEMWYKIYSPLVEGIEIVQRAPKRARRARLTFMRTVKHDRGSVENTVRLYLRQKAALGTSDGKKAGGSAAKGAAKAAAMGGKKKSQGRGKKR